MHANAIAIAVLFFVLAGAAFGAGPVSVPLPSVQTVFSARLTPDQLPARGRASVSLELTEAIGTPDGSHPPALHELGLELDRHWGLSVKGVPVCPGPLNESGPRTGISAICEDSKIGSGSIEAEVAFPEQQPVRTGGQVVVYNGGVRGDRTKIWVYAYFSAPATGAILMPLQVRRDSNGIYGWTGTLSVPKIANGGGSITDLSLKFGKGIFSATCPTGKWQGRASAHFVDGSVGGGAFVQRCRTAPASS